MTSCIDPRKKAFPLGGAACLRHLLVAKGQKRSSNWDSWYPELEQAQVKSDGTQSMKPYFSS
jgi:hypothetical protein